jgi:hypothetical protein
LVFVIVLGADLVSGVARAAFLFAACVCIALIVVLLPARLRSSVGPFAVAFVAAAGALPVFLSGDDAGDDGGTNPPRSSADGQPPDGALEDVLSHVPSGFREGCSEVPRPPDAAPASVNCYPGAGAEFVQYRKYSNSAGMKGAFDTDIEAVFGADPPLREGCVDDGTGLTTWEYGRVLCYVTGGEANVVWTDNRLIIYAWAKRGDDDFLALLDKWGEGAFGPSP